MRPSAVTTLVIACLSLLTVQMSDVHLHAKVGKHDDGVTHGAQLQPAFSSDHADDGSHADVSVSEPAPSSFTKTKSDVHATAPAITHFAFTAAWQVHPIPPEPAPVNSKHLRWRPPLRAPPALI